VEVVGHDGTEPSAARPPLGGAGRRKQWTAETMNWGLRRVQQSGTEAKNVWGAEGNGAVFVGHFSPVPRVQERNAMPKFEHDAGVAVRRP
jgi:hypothetical protein